MRLWRHARASERASFMNIHDAPRKATRDESDGRRAEKERDRGGGRGRKEGRKEEEEEEDRESSNTVSSLRTTTFDSRKTQQSLRAFSFALPSKHRTDPSSALPIGQWEL